MPLDFGIVFDCADPHTLADWWAETLEWEVEPSNEEFIRSMIEQGHATEDQTKTHNGVLVWREGAAIVRPGAAKTGEGNRRILFVLVPESKIVKNRVHLDVHVGADNVDATVAALVERGATELYEEHQGPNRWITMTDPEHNEFCIT